MAAKKGLGRGFGSLIPTDLLDESFDPTADQDERVSELRTIKLTDISPDPEQPRRHFDPEALAELAESIRQHGVVQPIVVVPKKGKYQIVAGERRWRGATMAGLEKIPALVRTLSGQHKLELSLIENLQRRDLNPLEMATAYVKLRDQFNLSLDQIGVRVGGKSVSAISNTIRLLRLPEHVRQLIAEGRLAEGQARALISLDQAVVDELLPRILEEEWSARRIEQVVAAFKAAGKKPEGEKKPAKTAEHEAHIAQLQRHFGLNVRIKTGTRGAGKIEIAFKSQREFERLQKMLLS